MSDHVERLLGPVLDAAAVRMGISTVAILGPKPGTALLHNDSSGVLLEIADVPFLLTAGHSVAQYVKHKIPLFALSGVPGSRIVPLAGAQALHVGDGIALDAAVLRLSQETADLLRRDSVFLKLHQVEVDHRLDGQGCYVIAGFPVSEFQIDLRSKKVKMDPLPYVTGPFLGNIESLPEFNPAVDYAFDYEKDEALGLDGSLRALPKPYGASGGGIWYIGNATAFPSFKPDDMRLVAIEHGFFGSQGAIVGAKLGIPITFINRTYPELRNSIGLHCRTSWPNCPSIPF